MSGFLITSLLLHVNTICCDFSIISFSNFTKLMYKCGHTHTFTHICTHIDKERKSFYKYAEKQAGSCLLVTSFSSSVIKALLMVEHVFHFNKYHLDMLTQRSIINELLLHVKVSETSACHNKTPACHQGTT